MKEQIDATLRELKDAWNRADGAAWADLCTPDVDFINLLGMYVKGRGPVMEVHDKIFKGPYKDSTLRFDLQHIREVSLDAALAVVACELQIPEGPVKGVVKTIATMLFVRNGDACLVASFQNTKREATQRDHTAIMLDTVGS